MNDSEIRAFLTIALMAAFADGGKDDREHAALKSLARGLARAGSISSTSTTMFWCARSRSRMRCAPSPRRKPGARPTKLRLRSPMPMGFTRRRKARSCAISPQRSECPRRKRKATWRKPTQSRRPPVSPTRAVPSRPAKRRDT